MSKEEQGVRLKRRFGVLEGVGIILGVVVGGGIFISPKGVIDGAGSPGLALVIWCLCGLAATTGALCFAELGTMFPVSGGKYVYLSEIYGPLFGCIYLMIYTIIIRPGFNSLKALIFAQYLLQPFYSYCGNDSDPPNSAVILVALCQIYLVTFVNIVKVKWAGYGHVFVCGTTISVLLIIIVYGFIYVAKGRSEVFWDGNVWTANDIDAGSITLAIYSALYAFSGWTVLNSITEEIKNPNRNLLLSICLSMAIVTLLYVGVNFAYFAVLGVDGVLTSNTVAVHFAEKVMGKLSWFVPVGVIITATGGINAGSLTGSRYTFAGGRKGHLPAVLGLININFKSPITSLIVQAVAVTVLMLTSGIQLLLNNLTFLVKISDTMAIIGLLYLRWTRPNMYRPVKLPLFIPVLSAVFHTATLTVPLIYTPRKVTFGLVTILCTGVPYYVLLKLWDRGYRIQSLDKYNRCLTVLVQKILVCVPQDESPMLRQDQNNK